MANNLLPFRAGELVRLIVATRLTGVRFSAALSSLAVERIFDGLTVVGLMGLALLASDLPPGVAIGGVPVAHAAQAAGAVVAVALLGAILVVAFPLAAERLVRRILPAGGFADRVVGLIEGIRQGLTALRSPGRLAGVVLWSLVLWFVNAYAFYTRSRPSASRSTCVGALPAPGDTGARASRCSSPRDTSVSSRPPSWRRSPCTGCPTISPRPTRSRFTARRFLPSSCWAPGRSPGHRSPWAISADIRDDRARLRRGPRQAQPLPASALAGGRRLSQPRDAVLPGEPGGWHSRGAARREGHDDRGGRGRRGSTRATTSRFGPRPWSSTPPATDSACTCRSRSGFRFGPAWAAGRAMRPRRSCWSTIWPATPCPATSCCQFAARLGSDVPFFLSGAPLALGW